MTSLYIFDQLISSVAKIYHIIDFHLKVNVNNKLFIGENHYAHSLRFEPLIEVFNIDKLLSLGANYSLSVKEKQFEAKAYVELCLSQTTNLKEVVSIKDKIEQNSKLLNYLSPINISSDSGASEIKFPLFHNAKANAQQNILLPLIESYMNCYQLNSVSPESRQASEQRLDSYKQNSL